MHESPFLFPVNLLIHAGIPEYVAFSWVATAIILVLAFMARKAIDSPGRLVPRGVQNLIEVIMEFFLDLVDSNIGHLGRHFFPFITTIGVYILVCNFLGLIPGCIAPTDNLNTNLALALPVFLATHFYGIKTHKFGYIKHFVGPMRSVAAFPLMILMFIIEVIGHIARPVTLSVRLFGNMIGKHLVLLILGLLVPIIVPTTILLLGTLVSVIQAFVFVLLTTLYLAGAVEEAH